MEFHILEIRHFKSPFSTDNPQNIVRNRTIKDYEIDLELSAHREYWHNGCRYDLHRGDVLIRKPNDVCSAAGFQESYMLTLSFTDGVLLNYHRTLPGPIQPLCQHQLIRDLPPLLHPEKSEVIMQIYQELLNLNDPSAPAAKALVMELLHRLMAERYRNEYEAVKPQDTLSAEAVTYMRRNLEKPLTLTELAKHANLEKSHFVRCFKRETGKTPIATLIALRMEAAAELVGNTKLKIGDIAAMCGYRNTSFFITEYKKRYGVSPSACRNATHGEE